MKRFLLTVLATLIIATAGMIGFLYTNGCISIEKNDINHNKVVMIDGEVVQSKNWTEVLGYSVEVHFNDHAYIGK